MVSGWSKFGRVWFKRLFLVLATLLVLLGILLAVILWPDKDMQTAMDAYSQGDYATAVTIFQQLADSDETTYEHKRAQYLLAMMYDLGQGVNRNDDLCNQYLRRSADQGYTLAQFQLARRYMEGKGMAPDYHQAAIYFEKAANRGHDQSKGILAVLYGRGQGVPQDLVQAYKWFSLFQSGADPQALALRKDLERQMTADQIAQAQKLIQDWKPVGIGKTDK